MPEPSRHPAKFRKRTFYFRSTRDMLNERSRRVARAPGLRRLVSRIRSSPYFAAPSERKLMIPVSFIVQKFVRRTRGNDGTNF
jgi:hypothetical protein